jgi:hypothetical protein
MSIISLDLSVPNEMSAIKLSQYQQYRSIVELNKDAENMDFINLKCLEIFCGLTLKESYNLPIRLFEGALRQIGRCLSEETPLIQTFKMVGSDDVEIEFGLIPDLSDISFGEYVDLENYIKEEKTWHKAMAVLYRPIKKSGQNYVIEPYHSTKKYEEVMKDMPVNIALGAMVFFYRLGSKLSRHMISSLESQKDQPLGEQQRTLEENGDGIKASMRLLEEMSQDLMRSQRFHYTNA